MESAPAGAWRGFHVVEARRKHWPCILLGCLTRAEAALFGLIGRQLSEILRLAASIQQGTVTASLILRKLGSYPRQNSPALALREIGRIERTLFAVAWIEDPSLRRRVTAGLNKGEARNSLARAVFFNRLGEIRDRSFENQPIAPAAKSRCRCHYALEYGLSRTGRKGAGKISACRSYPVSARLSTRLGVSQLNRRLHLAHQQTGC